MGNTISADTDYRIGGNELIELNNDLGEMGRDLDYHAQCMFEALNGIADRPESIARAIARFGALAVRAWEISRDYYKRLDLIAHKLAHTPIEQEDNNGK